MIPRNQLELADVFSECKDIFESDKPQFLSSLEEHIDLSSIVPRSFYQHFYSLLSYLYYIRKNLLWCICRYRNFVFSLV